MTNKFTQAFLLFVVILVLVGFSVVFTNRQSALPGQPSTGSESFASDPGQISALVVEKTYTADANTFSGSLMVDEPCSTLDTDVNSDPGDPEQITLVFDTSSAGKDCITSTPKKDFIVVVPSSQSAKLAKIVFNGTALAFEVRSQ